MNSPGGSSAPRRNTIDIVRGGLRRRYRRERRFRRYGIASVVIALASLALLFTDIVMPEMDGIELARRAAELDPHLKIMFITGFAAVALHPDSKAPKDAKVLSKPFHLRDLVAEVDRMMAA